VLATTARTIVEPGAGVEQRPGRRLGAELGVQPLVRIGHHGEREVVGVRAQGGGGRVEHHDLAHAGGGDLVVAAGHRPQVQVAHGASGEAPQLQVHEGVGVGHPGRGAVDDVDRAGRDGVAGSDACVGTVTGQGFSEVGGLRTMYSYPVTV
jgi:hypothetical protein